MRQQSCSPENHSDYLLSAVKGKAARWGPGEGGAARRDGSFPLTRITVSSHPHLNVGVTYRTALSYLGKAGRFGEHSAVWFIFI